MPKSQLSPTARTIRTLRAEGVICDICERWNAFGGPHGVRRDLFNIFDVIAISPDRGIIGVQCGGGSGHAAHRKKILENEIAPEWLKTGGRIEIWSWRKVKVSRGSKLERWAPRVEEITLEHFAT